MTPEAFGQTLLGWHDFFLASAGATAALLGLLFVGVSINLTTIAADERIDLRTRAAQAFANLIFVLVVSLLMLVPAPEPSFIATGLAAVAAFGLLRVGQNVYRLVGGRGRVAKLRPTLRRIGWTAVADVILGFTAWRIWATAGEAVVISNLIAVVFVLLIGAADIAWEMLTEVSTGR
jgi:hypothetical protein